MNEPLKNRSYKGKKYFLIFWTPIFSRPKAATDVKNSLYYGRNSIKNSELLTTLQSAIRLETVLKITNVKAPINICLKRDIAKKKSFQIINNNNKRLNVKFLKKKAIPLKKWTSVDNPSRLCKTFWPKVGFLWHYSRCKPYFLKLQMFLSIWTQDYWWCDSCR